MKNSPWQGRIERAQELAGQYPAAGEILGFYIHVARFQEGLHHWLRTALPERSCSTFIDNNLEPSELSALSSRFDSFLSLAAEHGPARLALLSRELSDRGTGFWSKLLDSTWSGHGASDAQEFLALAFLQPYGELRRSRAKQDTVESKYALCPFCRRKPGFGVLRQMGDGAARALVCGFCLAEWAFRRIVCPGCGEEDDRKLPVFAASDFDYIRVECCETCKTYIKSVDLTKNGRAEPVVDELASATLDLWAKDRGYAKLQSNILGM